MAGSMDFAMCARPMSDEYKGALYHGYRLADGTRHTLARCTLQQAMETALAQAKTQNTTVTAIW